MLLERFIIRREGSPAGSFLAACCCDKCLEIFLIKK
jgi:hypothetical protein